MRTRNKIIVIIALAVLILPSVTQAVSWWPLVPCGLNAQPTDSDGVEIPKSVHDYTQPCNQCDLFRLLKNVIDFILVGLMPAAATILFVWAGFLVLMGGANQNWVSQGRTIFWNTSMGIAIISGSWLITNSIIRSIADDNVATEWWKFECRVPASNNITSTSTSSTGTGTGSGSGTGTGGSGTGTGTGSGTGGSSESGGSSGSGSGGGTGTGSGTVTCGAGVNLCQGKQTTCTYSSCGTYANRINEYASRTGLSQADGAKLLKAIMVNESQCNALASNGSEHGIMQLTTQTAQIYKSRCGVGTATITSQWLKDNTTGSICIAAEYIKAISQTSCGTSPRNLAAGYNGGPGACQRSNDCTNDRSCDGSPVKKWECLYDNPQHNTCNTGYNVTREYATKVLYCYNNPGF